MTAPLVRSTACRVVELRDLLTPLRPLLSGFDMDDDEISQRLNCLEVASDCGSIRFYLDADKWDDPEMAAVRYAVSSLFPSEVKSEFTPSAPGFIMIDASW
jgi:hypothetical protein